MARRGGDASDDKNTTDKENKKQEEEQDNNHNDDDDDVMVVDAAATMRTTTTTSSTALEEEVQMLRQRVRFLEAEVEFAHDTIRHYEMEAEKEMIEFYTVRNERDMLLAELREAHLIIGGCHSGGGNGGATGAAAAVQAIDGMLSDLRRLRYETARTSATDFVRNPLSLPVSSQQPLMLGGVRGGAGEGAGGK